MKRNTTKEDEKKFLVLLGSYYCKQKGALPTKQNVLNFWMILIHCVCQKATRKYLRPGMSKNEEIRLRMHGQHWQIMVV